MKPISFKSVSTSTRKRSEIPQWRKVCRNRSCRNKHKQHIKRPESENEGWLSAASGFRHFRETEKLVKGSGAGTEMKLQSRWTKERHPLSCFLKSPALPQTVNVLYILYLSAGNRL
ncbi:hypothetical protein OS493_023566 [Desmophyllum pertusum]|uniref:Uncharacterized protein n=1 Tax=Desmophyllum pertusum TaxID=174260 RepID=A0A9W9ZC75_9CNID|nr:hypothetical protein OS493_023566 [Desmophyllum pertusum]